MEGPELTLDALEKMHAKRGDSTIELEITRTDVSAGPAIRRRLVQGSLAPGSSKDDASEAVVYAMSWVLIDDFPTLTEIAGSLVKTLIVATGE